MAPQQSIGRYALNDQLDKQILSINLLTWCNSGFRFKLEDSCRISRYTWRDVNDCTKWSILRAVIESNDSLPHIPKPPWISFDHSSYWWLSSHWLNPVLKCTFESSHTSSAQHSYPALEFPIMLSWSDLRTRDLEHNASQSGTYLMDWTDNVNAKFVAGWSLHTKSFGILQSVNMLWYSLTLQWQLDEWSLKTQCYQTNEVMAVFNNLIGLLGLQMHDVFIWFGICLKYLTLNSKVHVTWPDGWCISDVSDASMAVSRYCQHGQSSNLQATWHEQVINSDWGLTSWYCLFQSLTLVSLSHCRILSRPHATHLEITPTPSPGLRSTYTEAHVCLSVSSLSLRLPKAEFDWLISMLATN